MGHPVASGFFPLLRGFPISKRVGFPVKSANETIHFPLFNIKFLSLDKNIKITSFLRLLVKRNLNLCVTPNSMMRLWRSLKKLLMMTMLDRSLH